MARLDWMTFLANYPKAHLLAGHVPDPNALVLKRLRRLMQSLIDGEDPSADYATAIVRGRDGTEIHCGFVERSDADRVGARLGAKAVAARDDWLSERRLRLNARAEHMLEGKEARPRPRAAKRVPMTW